MRKLISLGVAAAALTILLAPAVTTAEISPTTNAKIALPLPEVGDGHPGFAAVDDHKLYTYTEDGIITFGDGGSAIIHGLLTVTPNLDMSAIAAIVKSLNAPEKWLYKNALTDEAMNSTAPPEVGATNDSVTGNDLLDNFFADATAGIPWCPIPDTTASPAV